MSSHPFSRSRLYPVLTVSHPPWFMSDDTSRPPSVPLPPNALLTVIPTPSTVISPPTPISVSPSEQQGFQSTSIPSHSPIIPEDVIEYDSPEEESDDEEISAQAYLQKVSPRSRQRRPSGTLPFPVAADSFSSSPTGDVSLLSFDSSTTSLVTTLGEPMELPSRARTPSSPGNLAEPRHHRRTSSTHRVRETMFGEQRATNTGEIMVNQYRLGASIGNGAYAKVELGEDISTGKLYVRYR